MKKYTRAYTRENTLFSIQVWEDQQARRLEKYFGWNAPLSVFDAHGGVVAVYYDEKIFDIWYELISTKANSDPKLIDHILELYSKQIDELEQVWKKGVFDTREELVAFYDFMAEMWIGLSVSYCLPDMKNITKELQDLGMDLRRRSVDFLDNTDRVVFKSLQKLYPELGDLVKYVSIEEIRADKLEPLSVLEARKKHYVFFDFKILTDADAFKLARENGIEIVEEAVPQGTTELKGQTAMKGKVTGSVRVLKSKAEIKDLIEGEILVTAMTTPDYLPAMNKAAAFVTDEGGITCHAAIVAREMGKPCVIGTKIATRALKTGDTVEVDADKGVVKIIK